MKACGNFNNNKNSFFYSVFSHIINTDQVEQMSVSIRQLEMERNEMIRSLENEEKQRQVVQKELDELRSQLASQSESVSMVTNR